ncbi:MAG: hypothetical protein HKL80_03280 [Acidimicrobiales bacterium]|nr:hypothetical protein [Acidimicrobiales bacterium]
MTPEVLDILSAVEELSKRLKEPVSEEMRAGGWREESALLIAGSLDKFATKIRLIDELPPMSERPWDMPRGLDSHGVHGGGPFDDLLALGHKLRQAP